jgi:hypothetical protein
MRIQILKNFNNNKLCLNLFYIPFLYITTFEIYYMKNKNILKKEIDRKNHP